MKKTNGINGTNGAVIEDMRIKGGVPCVAGTRIPVQNIVYLHKHEKASAAKIAGEFYTQLTPDQVQAVLEWAKKRKYGMAS